MGICSRGVCAALLACLVLATRAEAQASLELYAGGTPFVDRPADSVPMQPTAMTLAPDGSLYVADDASGKILRYDPATSTISSVPNLPGLYEYRFASPKALAWNPSGMLNLLAGPELWQLDLVDGFRIFLGAADYTHAEFAADDSVYLTRIGAHAIYRRTPSGTIQLFEGSSAIFGFSGDGTTTARFNDPRGMAIDAAGNIYIADSGNNRVRRRDAATGIITTVAGTGLSNYNGDNLPATQTNLSAPNLLALDSTGNLYINEEGGNRIRKLTAATGLITNFVGDGNIGDPGNGGPAVNASINDVVDIDVAPDGTFFLAERSGWRIRKVDTSGIITQIMGNGTRSFCGEGVPAREACLNRPNGITIDDAGDVYISDQFNRRIRKISAATGIITTIAGVDSSISQGDGGPATAAYFPNGTSGLAVDGARNLYISANGRIRRIDSASGIITTYAGLSSPGFSGDGGPAIAARFNGTSRVALDAAGNLYISDIYNNRVRRVDAVTGIITTVAGNGTSTGPLGDGGPATQASLYNPHGLAFDPEGNLLIGDTFHYRIRKLNVATGIITTVAGNGSANIDGNGGLATQAGIGSWPAFDVDSDGNIYLAASFELRRVDAQTGIIDSVPAPIWGLYTPEGRGLENPNDMVLGADNRLYITDAATNNLVLRVSGLPTPASDMTPPVIEPVITGTLGNDGWYTSDVTVSWSVTDDTAVTSTSGCDASVVTTDTAGATFTCAAMSAGGSSTRSVTIRRDATAPQIMLTAPASGAGYAAGEVVNSQYACSDTLSGIASCAGPVASGSPVPTATAGTRTFQVQATDAAGNTASVSHGYTVTAPVLTFTFERFIEPLRRSPHHNGITAGDLVPIRWRLIDSTGSPVTNPAAFQSLTVLPLTCQAAPIPLNDPATGGEGLSVNASTGVFTYNWQTDASWTGCRRVQVRFSDNSIREVVFRFQ